MSQHKHHNAVTQALALLEATKTGMAAILQHPELQTFRTRINVQLNKAGQSLQGLTGAFMVAGSTIGSEVNQITAGFAPLDSIGGEPIGRQKPVTPETLDVSEADKEVFLTRRAELASRFLEMTNDQVFKFLKEPMGTALVRSLAKVSGHPGWVEAQITAGFLEEVRENIRFNAALAQTVSIADDAGSSAAERGEDEDQELDDSTNVRTGAPQYGPMINTAGATRTIDLNDQNDNQEFHAQNFIPVSGNTNHWRAEMRMLDPQQQDQNIALRLAELDALQEQYPDEYLEHDRDLEHEWPSTELKLAYFRIFPARLEEPVPDSTKPAATTPAPRRGRNNNTTQA